MALKGVLVWAGCVPQLGGCGSGDLGSKRKGFSLNWRKENGGVCKWECYGVSGPLLVQNAITPVEDGNPSSTPVELQQIVDQNTSKKSQKDFSSLPRPLSVTDPSVSPNNGSIVRVGYQGVPGAYSEAAALKAYPECETVPCDQFETAFKAVELWLVDKVVLPIENSLGGSIHRNYDLLLQHRLHIVGEVQLAVNHCLLGLPGVTKDELKRVLSHPQALSQCENTLSKLGVAKEDVDGTSGAAKFVALSGLRDTGAVASARAAEIYGLNILAERIQTSVVFTLEEGLGVLFKALAVFALRGINLTKIESRPPSMQPWRIVDDSNTSSAKYFGHLFYIDFEASMAEQHAQNALEHLQEFATFLRVLGCYPMDMSI